MICRKLWGGAFLVAGTSIGAATLALPVATASIGLFGTLVLFLLCWLVMLASALMLLEVNIASGKSDSFMSMAEKTLGAYAKWVVAVLYAILLYSLMAAYLRGSGDLVHGLANVFFLADLSSYLEPLPCTLFAAIALYFGAKCIDRLNSYMMYGLIISFTILVCSLLLVANLHTMTYSIGFSFLNMLKLLPIAITAFGFQVIVPTLRHYMHKELDILPKTITLGSLIPFVIYLIWSVLIYMCMPTTGEFSLSALFTAKQPVVSLPIFLNSLYHNKIITSSISLFAFFALASSLLGISISLFDLLADKFFLKMNNIRVYLIIAVLLPPLLFAEFFPEGFLLALKYAGIFVAILNIFLPAVMVLKIRKTNKVTSFKAPVGSFVIYSTIVIALLIVIVSLVLGA
jgi:tyrosine-specific transport protein